MKNHTKKQKKHFRRQQTHNNNILMSQVLSRRIRQIRYLETALDQWFFSKWPIKPHERVGWRYNNKAFHIWCEKYRVEVLDPIQDRKILDNSPKKGHFIVIAYNEESLDNVIKAVYTMGDSGITTEPDEGKSRPLP